MEKQMIFHILEIGEEALKENPPKGREAYEEMVKSAYRTLLRKANPEDDPEGFKRIRQAYEEALALMTEVQDDSLDGREETEGGFWLQKVGRVYEDMEQRRSLKAWEELLQDEFCDGLDTSVEAGERLLTFLMDHIYLPWAVWKMIDEKLQIVRNQKELMEKYPKNFLSYITYYIQNEGFISYDLFEMELEQDADSWIRHYLDVKKQVDQGKTEGGLQALDDLQAFGVYHPYGDVERARIFLADGRGEEAEQAFDRLMRRYPLDCYILIHGAECKWKREKKEEADEIWQQVLSKMPDHYQARVGVIRYQVETGRYYEAREQIMKLMERQNQDDAVLELLQTANSHLIEIWSEKIGKGEDDPCLKGQELKLELGWCLFQNERLEEAVALLEQETPECSQEYGYCNLFGRVLYQKKEFERALPYLKRWLELILETVEDGSEENTRRILREGKAWYILGGCYHELGREEEAIEAAIHGTETEKDQSQRLSCMQYLSYLYVQSKQYEKAVDICDKVLAEDEGYYPAYLQRQEAFFAMHNGQGVVDDYYHATELLAGYYKPYLLAAQTYFYYNQFAEGKHVLDRARENHVAFTRLMKLFEVKLLRNLAESQDERQAAMDICRGLLQTATDEIQDIEDLSEVEYELALLMRDSGQTGDCLEHLQTAIRQNPDRMQYRMVRAQLYLDEGDYEKAELDYRAAAGEYEGTPGYHYGMGLCYEKKNKKVLAREQLEEALKLQEDYRDANERVSDLYQEEYQAHYRRSDLEQALAFADRQLALGESCYYLVQRGLLYMDALELEPAIADFEKALTYSPGDWAAYNNLGCCYKYLGEFEKAIELFRKSLDCLGADKKVLPYSNMADCYEALGEYEKAIECYRKDLEWFPYPIFWEEIGNLQACLNQYEEAFKAFESAKERWGYYKNRAMTWYRRGYRLSAMACFRRSMANAEVSERPGRQIDYGTYCMEILGQYRRAVRWFTKAIAGQNDLYQLFLYYSSRARAYYLNADRKKAKNDAQKALEYFHRYGNGTLEDYLAFKPLKPIRLNRMGWLHLCMGNDAEAMRCFEEMQTCIRCKRCRNQGCFESHLSLGLYYESRGDVSLALEEYGRAEELHPTSIPIQSAAQRCRKKKK